METVFKSIFERTMILKGEFSDTCQLRTHVDANEDELTIVCDYSEHDLLSLVQNKSNLSLRQENAYSNRLDRQWTAFMLKIGYTQVGCKKSITPPHLH